MNECRRQFGYTEAGASVVVNCLRFSRWPAPTVMNCHCSLRLQDLGESSTRINDCARFLASKPSFVSEITRYPIVVLFFPTQFSKQARQTFLTHKNKNWTKIRNDRHLYEIVEDKCPSVIFVIEFYKTWIARK